VARFKYLGRTVTNQKLNQEDNKGSFNSGYCSVQNLLSSCLLSKNVTIRIFKTIFLPVALYGCETWSLTLREKHIPKVYENRVLRIFGPKSDEVTGGQCKLHNEFHNLYSLPSIIRMFKSRRMR
jgi:hypothetical protein